MICSRSAVRLLAVAALAVAGACSDTTTPSEPGAAPALQAAQAPDLATLARVVPP